MSLMKKKQAIQLLGGTVAMAAEAIRINSQAISQWPEDLPPRLVDRVIAACAREGIVIPAELLSASPEKEVARNTHKAAKRHPKPTQPLDLSTTDIPTTELDKAGLVDRREGGRRADDVAKEAELQALKAGKGPAA